MDNNNSRQMTSQAKRKLDMISDPNQGGDLTKLPFPMGNSFNQQYQQLQQLQQLQQNQPPATAGNKMKDDVGLFAACGRGELQSVQDLLRRHASHFQDVNRVYEYAPGMSSTMLICAAEYGQAAVVNYLVEEHHAHVDASDEEGNTALMKACMGEHEQMVQYLLSKGANVNFKNRTGYVALHYAASKSNAKVVLLLLTRGALVNAKSNDGNTALMRAAAFNTLPIVELLLEHGADTMIKNLNGKKAYRYATNKKVRNKIQDKMIVHRQLQANQIASQDEIRQNLPQGKQQSTKQNTPFYANQPIGNNFYQNSGAVSPSLSVSTPIQNPQPSMLLPSSSTTTSSVPALQLPQSQQLQQQQQQQQQLAQLALTSPMLLQQAYAMSMLQQTQQSQENPSNWRSLYEHELQLRIFAEARLNCVELELRQQYDIVAILQEKCNMLLTQLKQMTPSPQTSFSYSNQQSSTNDENE